MDHPAHVAQQAAAVARYHDAADARATVARRRHLHGSKVADTEAQVEARFGRLLKTGQVPPEAIDAAVSASEPVERQVLLERIIGATNDLQPAKFLARGARTIRTIARISMNDHGALAPRGTGFLVSPRLLLTNNHVLGDPAEASRAVVEFNYEIDADDRPAVVATYVLDPDRLFITDATLDYTLVTVRPDGAGDPPGATFGWNRLVSEQGKVVNGESINVVGHPMGRLKEIAIRNGVLQFQHEQFLNYTTDTEQGCSGSPVFNDQWEVVALHHACIPRPQTNGTRARPGSNDAFVNEGARVSAVVGHIMQQQVSAEQRALLDELSRPRDAASAGGDPNGHRNPTTGGTRERTSDGTRPARLERVVATPNGAPTRGPRVATNGGGDVVWVYGIIPVPLTARP